MDESGSAIAGTNNTGRKKPLYYVLKQGIKLVAVYPALATVIVFVLMYFAISVYSDRVVSQTMLDTLRKDISDISQRDAALISQKLNEVSSFAAILQPEHEFYLALPRNEPVQLLTPEPVFFADERGLLYKTTDNGGAALYYSLTTPPDSAQMWKARATERLDLLYKKVTERSPVVSQVYFNSWDNMTRIYPFSAEPERFYGTQRQVSNHSFYYLADAAHNPQRKVVWTSAYMDPAGSGWIASAIAPVYNGDFLEGVLGLDIRLDLLLNHMINSEYLSSDGMLLLDQQQRILAVSPALSNLLNDESQPEQHQRYYGRSVADLPQADLANGLAAILAAGKPLSQLNIDDQHYLVSLEKIAETGWYMLALPDISEVMQPLSSLKQIKVIIGFMAMALISLCTLIYLRYVFYLSDRFSDEMVQPINELAERTTHFSREGIDGLLPHHAQVDDNNIREVAVLVSNFNQMAVELNSRSQQLIEANLARKIIEEKARLYQVMANTDQLTGLHNRKYIDMTLRQEGIRSNRYNCDLTVLMLDVDHFKAVNDNFGHQVGDLVLSRVARTLKSHIREADILGRWGGEEFLLVCPNTRLDDARVLAEKLREAVENIQFEQDLSITASIGLAQLVRHERTEKTVARADAMLYKAKRNGRNRVEYDHEDLHKKENTL